MTADENNGAPADRELRFYAVRFVDGGELVTSDIALVNQLLCQPRPIFQVINTPRGVGEPRHP